MDSLIASGSLQAPDLIKIDVEGAEVDVLRGAAQLLEDSHPIIFIEAHSADLERECMQELKRFGYRFTLLESEELPPDAARHLVCEPDAWWLQLLFPSALSTQLFILGRKF